MASPLHFIFKSRRRLRVALTIVIVIVVSIALDQIVIPWIVHSRGTITMPSVVGMPQEHAVALLQQRGLQIQDIQQQFDSSQPAGRIILQSPYAGATIRQGRRVYLVVSRGYEVVRVPSLYGMPLRQAQLELLRVGLQLGRVQTVACDSMSNSGQVVAQIPAATVAVRTGTTVELTICHDSTSTTIVPNLIYRSRNDAESMLLQANLQLGEVIMQYDETFAPGTVLRQEPAPGSRVPTQTVVRLWVASNL